jgi:hypothetical protein
VAQLFLIFAAKAAYLIETNNISSATIGDSLDSFGSSLAIATDYAIIGAPDTQSGVGAAFPYYIDSAGTFNRRPAIRPSTLSSSHLFATSMAMSGDGRYLFIGAPGDNRFYVYTLIELDTASERTFTITTTVAEQPIHWTLHLLILMHLTL